MNEWILLGIGVVLTIGTGFFVASEFALLNIDRADLEKRQEKGQKGLGTVIGALKITSTHLSSAQVGITLTTLLAGYTLEPALTIFLQPLFDALSLPEAISRPLAVIISVTIATILSMIVGELVPKNFALALPLATARVVLPFQVVFTFVFGPLVKLLNGTSNAVLRSMGVEPKEELSSARSAEELSSLVRRSALEGSLDYQTATLLAKTLEFSERTASDVMTPRPRMKAVERTDSALAVIEMAKTTGYSRFPVISETADDVVGVVHLKQAVSVPRERRADVPISALQSDALRVPETMRLDTLLGELRGKSYQMAIVVDEYGGTAGVATLEDLVEELVGEVADEHDRMRTGVARLRDGAWLLPGMLRPDELKDQTLIEIPEDGTYETLGGFVMEQLGRIPAQGDIVEIEGGALRVERMEGRRVDRLRYLPQPDTGTPNVEEV